MSRSNKSKKDTSSADAISNHRMHAKDTGSPEVQIAQLTARLETLTKHFETHREDSHSRRGMFKMIAQRKSLLEYLKRENIERYRSTINTLGLRK